MSKHTPGPWTIADEWDGTSIKAGQFYVTHTIQSCGFHETEVDKAVTQANARLIAAAPDLLEACKAALSDDQPYIEKCKAAIAKATGEQA
jgi:hypothetical protein